MLHLFDILLESTDINMRFRNIPWGMTSVDNGDLNICSYYNISSVKFNLFLTT